MPQAAEDELPNPTTSTSGPGASRSGKFHRSRFTAAAGLVALGVLATVLMPNHVEAREEDKPQLTCEVAKGRLRGPALPTCVEPPAPPTPTPTAPTPTPTPSPTPTPTPTPPTGGTRPTAAVSLGDSFISGEGGGGYEPVFGHGQPIWPGHNKSPFWCYRSDQAHIHTAALPGIDQRFNRSCSGAIPEHINGLSSRIRFDLPGDPAMESQLDQLATVHATHDIALVVIGIGGNQDDAGFGDSIGACVAKFYHAAFDPLQSQPCTSGDLPSSADLVIARHKTRDAIRSVISRMETLGYQPGEFRLVVQNYTNPLGEQFAAPWQTGPAGASDSALLFSGLFHERYSAGCPIHEASNTRGHQFTNQMNDMVEASALEALTGSFFAGHDVVFLDVADAFDGDRICENAASPAGALAAPFRVRALNSGVAFGSLQVLTPPQILPVLASCKAHVQLCQESLHPSALGHAALGECLGEAWLAAPNSRVDCDRVGGTTTATNAADWIAGPDLVINVVWNPVGGGRGAFTVDYAVVNVPPGSPTYDVTVTIDGDSFTNTTANGTVDHTTLCNQRPRVSVEARTTVAGNPSVDTAFWELPGAFPINFLGC